MANTYTTRAGLAKPATNDTSWGTTLNGDFDALDALQPVGALAVSLTEVPSASLNVAVAGGTFMKSDGTTVTYAGTASQAMTASQTNYLYLTDSGTLTVNTTGFPATTFQVRLATVVAGGTTITSITDARVPFASSGKNRNTLYLALSGGTLDDSGGVISVGTGTTNGTKIGATTADKLGLWGATPVVQPSGANQAAITDSTGGTAGFTLADVTASHSQSILNNNFASIARQQAAFRTALVAAGVIKGSA
jgi:hypothetical protein